MTVAGRTRHDRPTERGASRVEASPPNRSQIPRLVDITTIAAHLDVSVRHVRRLVAERRIPYVKWGNLLRFDPVAVGDWLRRNTVPPADHRDPHQGGSR
jgi:excisionase family DNA binding protein